MRPRRVCARQRLHGNRAIPEQLVDPRREQLDRLVADRPGGGNRVGELGVGESVRAARRDVMLDAGAAVAPDGRADRGELLVALPKLHHTPPGLSVSLVD
jgi:hypothetical protein